jgi:cytochrome P450
VFGHVGPYLCDKLGFLQRAARDCGDVVELQLGPRTFLISNAGDVQHIVQTCGERYQKGSQRMTEAGRRLAGRGLLTSAGQEHLDRKRILQALFTQATMARFGSVMTDLTAQRTAEWRDGAVIDVEVEMLRLTQDVSGLALLGEDYRTDAPGFAEAIRSWRRYLQYWFDYPVPFRNRLPLPVVWKHKRARVLIQDTLTRHLRKRQSAPGDDLLTMLCQLSAPDAGGLTDQEIVDEAHTIALTAYDTVAEGLVWTLYLLSQHPDVEARVLDELRERIGNRRVTADDYQNLPYLRRVFAESMRLYPPSWLFTRVAVQDDQLPSGAKIPAGVTLFISPWVIQRREAYFPDPTRFDPERFVDQAEANRPTFAYLPFGGGRHVCIGQALARIESVLVLATILPTYQLELASNRVIVPDPRMTLRPKHGLRMRVRRR